VKRVIIIAFACATAVALGIVAMFAFGMTATFTECYGDFDSARSAEAAAADAEGAGFDARVDRRHRGAVVFFEDGETDDDAADFRRTFQDVLRRHDGVPGHPGDGCVERTGFD
jgi:hypothetical protein